MTSQATIAANRRNAARSTGPRTAEGKTRSSRNAFQHGLSLPLPIDDGLAAQIEELAEQYLTMTGCSREAARLAATEQVGLLRIQQARVAAINSSIQEGSSGTGVSLIGERGVSLAIADTLPTLVAFDRYERRALSQCKEAFRRLEASDDPRFDNELATEGVRLSYRLFRCTLSRVRKPGGDWREKRRKVIAGMARLARKYIVYDRAEAAIGYLDRILPVAPDDLLLHAVRTCAQMVIGHPDARNHLLRYCGQWADGVRWEEMILNQLHQLRKAPRMRRQIISDVAAMLGCEPRQ